MNNKYANYPFPHKSKYAVEPALPTGIKTDEKIIRLFRQILLNDLIIDTNAPAVKGKFRMVFCHCQKWILDEVSHITTSESHGYGMMILAYMAGCEEDLGLLPGQWICGCDNLQDYFDAMLRTVQAFPSVIGKNNRLFAWELLGYPADGKNKTGYKKADGISSAPFSRDSESGDCATDGDMDIICALLLADKQWGSGGMYNYKQIALDMLDSLWDYCVHKEHHTLLLGDWASSRGGSLGNATRLSDVITGHLKLYAETDKKHDWQKVIDANYNVIRDLCEGKKNQNGLLPDFAVWEDGKWKAPDKKILEGDDGAYSYNACRVPWRLGCDYLLYGDTKIGESSLYKMVIKPLDEFAMSFNGGNMDSLGPFNLDGTALGESDPETFAAPFIVTAVANNASQDWVHKTWSWHGLDKYNGDNYGDYVKLLSMLAAAGNAWLPGVM
jgi:endo-1,4-beta-D-glucanase Y